MWKDLTEHIGTVIAILGIMGAALAGCLRIMWGWIQEGINKFPKWLQKMDEQGGVVTHKQLSARAIGMTEDEHEVICGKVTVMVLTRVEQSEKHQKELMEAFGKQFEALLHGQKDLINRLAEIQDVVLDQLNKMPKRGE